MKKLSPARRIEPGDIVVAGLFGTVSGLGVGVRTLVDRMRSVGMKVGTANISRVALLEDLDGGPVWSNDHTEGGVLIMSLNPNLIAFAFTSLGYKRISSRHVIGIWYWELQTFPKDWETAVRCVDEFWVGSRFIAEGLAKIAGSKPIHVVPMPIDVSAYPAPPTRDPLPP
ncbi:MAG: hypothetical protein PHE27_00690, partial [Alphaproteobacteria bacterium]|nr:hypothetical protein [Alphaproteobacteria bacterium]